MKSLIVGELEKYLQAVSGSGEAGLVIVPKGMQSEAMRMLGQHGFELLENPARLKKLNLARVSKPDQKFWYDIAAQFPQGQLQWIDPETKELKSLNIHPSEISLVLLCDDSLFDGGPDFREVSGAAFRPIF